MGGSFDRSAYVELVEREWDGYDELYDYFEWSIPETFNLAAETCDRWAEDSDRVAIYARDREGNDTAYTFRELQRDANRLANFFESRGIGQGDRICVSGSQTVETMVGNLAAWKLGAVSVPLSVLLGPEALSYRLSDSGASAYLVAKESIETLRKVGHDLGEVVVMDDVEPVGDEVTYPDALSGNSSTYATRETSPDDEAIIIYTSGTTGQPKGTIHGHKIGIGVLPCILLGAFDQEMHESDVGRTAVEWSWAGALADFVLPHWIFGKPVVALAHDDFAPETEFDLIDEFDVTIFNAPPTALRMLSQVDDPTDRYDLSSIRTLFSGGEVVGQSIFDWAAEVFDNATLQQGYGQTEAPGFIGDCESLGVPYEHGKIGKPSPGNHVRILDPDTGEPTVEQGDVGEIGLKYEDNPGCFLEYWNKPEKTDRKIQDGWLLSEDLGRRTDDGYIVFEGRKDDVIISSGYKIGPEEIEDVLAQHEAVADAGVIGIPDETRGEIPKAFVTTPAETEPADELAEKLRTFVRDRLAKYEYPRTIEFINELPKTTSGKLRRTELREREGLR